MTNEKQTRAGMKFSNMVQYGLDEEESVEGIIVGLSLEEGKEEKMFHLYHLNTKEGIIKVSLNEGMWNTIKESVFIGDRIRFTCTGTKDIGQPSPMKLYQCEILEEGEGLVCLDRALSTPHVEAE